MLEKIFLEVLNMSFTASFVIAFVLGARLLLKKAPKAFSYALWSVVLFRLVCPFSFESMYSLLPTRINPISQDIIYMQTPKIDTGLASINNIVNSALPSATPYVSINPLQIWIFIASLIWISGIAALALYSLITLLSLKKRLQGSTHYKDNIFISDKIETAFVMGIFSPRIYVPSNIKGQELSYILVHEQTHIKKFDHIIKFISYLALCIHWFNPLVWASFFFSGQDMEMACDEAVIRRLGNDIKKDYSYSLLMLATKKPIGLLSPLAFGEGDTKERIKNVLNFKKPGFWVIIITLLIVLLVGAGLLANPQKDPVPLTYPDDISTISIEQIDQGASFGAIEISDLNDIELVIHALQSTSKTLSDSVNDYPNAKTYLQIDIIGSTTQRFYLYNDGKKNYIEQPYVGIYKINSKDSDSIANLYASNTGLLSQYNTLDLWQARTKYIGDNSAVSKLIGLLKIPQGLSYDYFELQSSEQPYRISIYYSLPAGSIEKYEAMGSTAADLFRQNALLMLALVDNAGDIRAVITDGDRELEFINNREWADNVAGGNIRDYAASPEKLQQLIELDRNTGSSAEPLDIAIHEAILENNHNDYRKSDISLESHIVLETETSGSPGSDRESENVTVYAMVLYLEYDLKDAKIDPSTESGSHVPVALTFDISADGSYLLHEYWQPRDGSYYKPDIEGKFPKSAWRSALDTQRFIERHQENIDRELVARGYMDDKDQ